MTKKPTKIKKDAPENGFDGLTVQDIRRNEICKRLAKESIYKVVEELGKEWNIRQNTMYKLISDAVRHQLSEENKEMVIAQNMMRLNDLYEEAREDLDRKSALKAIDTQNKMVGAYEEKIKIDDNDDIELKFSFK